MFSVGTAPVSDRIQPSPMASAIFCDGKTPRAPAGGPVMAATGAAANDAGRHALASATLDGPSDQSGGKVTPWACPSCRTRRGRRYPPAAGPGAIVGGNPFLWLSRLRCAEAHGDQRS